MTDYAPHAKRCVGCGLWLSVRTQVCYICEAEQPAPGQAKTPVNGKIEPAIKRPQPDCANSQTGASPTDQLVKGTSDD